MVASYLQEIADRLDAGSRLEEVVSEVIDPRLELSDDDRAALWLYAWSYDARAGVHRASPQRVWSR